MLKKSAFLQKLLLKLPRPIANGAYAFARRFVYRDPRRDFFEKTFHHVAANKVPGDYLEFGVYRGTSLVACYKAAQRQGLKNIRFFAFDSFEGLPNSEGGIFRQGDFACAKDTFLQIIAQAGIDVSRVRAVEGFFEQSLTPEVKVRHELRRAAVVHADCDLYSSTTQVLRFVEDLIDVGTVLIFDDWHTYARRGRGDDHGEQRAFAEWRLKDCFDLFYDSPVKHALCSRAYIMARPKP